MRILHAFKDYYPPTHGGIEQHLNEVVHSVRGHESTVLTSSRRRRSVVDQDGDVRVIRSKEYFRPVSTPITPAWVGVLNRSDADVLHFHMPNPFGELALLASSNRAPLVASYHADIVGRRSLLPFFSPFQRRFLARSKHIVVGSPNLLATAPALQGHRAKAVVVPYGVDVAYWRSRPAESDAIRRRRPGPIVLLLGRLSYYKGAGVLVQAMRSVEATCLVVGGGPMLSSCRALAGELGLGDKVSFVGRVEDDERRAYYHAADVYVLPSTSRAESFGISMLEAMACGTPAVSTELGTGTSWVNQHGVTGLVVRPDDPQALAEAVTTVLGDATLRDEMGRAAAERAATQFTKQAMVGALQELYRSLG